MTDAATTEAPSTVLEGEVLDPLPPAKVLALIDNDPKAVFVNAAHFDVYYAELERRLAAEPVDLTTTKGRDAVKSRAASVTRAKTAIDRGRKELTEEWRKKTAEVNATGAVYVEKLDELAKATRKPLTDWEAEEETKRQNAALKLQWLQDSGRVVLGETSATVQARLTEVEDFLVDVETFGDLEPAAKVAWLGTVETLTRAVEHLKASEAQAAELAEMRRQNEERAAKDAADRAAEAAQRAEEQRQRDLERDAELAELKRQNEAAAAAQAAKDKEAADALAAANAKAKEAQDKLDAMAAAETQRLADEALAEAERVATEAAEKKRLEDEAAAEAQRIADEEAAEAKRRNDADLRNVAMAEAVGAVIEKAGPKIKATITTSMALAIVEAIAAGGVPHLTFSY